MSILSNIRIVSHQNKKAQSLSMECEEIENSRYKTIISESGKLICKYDSYDNHKQYCLKLLSFPHTVIPILGEIDYISEDFTFFDLNKKYNEVMDKIDSYGEDYDKILYRWSKEMGTNPEKTIYSKIGEIEEVGTHHICFNVADYISTLWGAKYGSLDLSITSWDYLLDSQKGVFIVQFENNVETHALVMYLTNNKIHIFQGYVGHIGMIYISSNIREWKKDFRSISKVQKYSEQKKLILKLFKFPPQLFTQYYKKHEESDEPVIFESLIEYARIC